MKIYRKSDGTADVPLYKDVEIIEQQLVAKEPLIYCAFSVDNIFDKEVPKDQAQNWWEILINDGFRNITDEVIKLNRDFEYVHLERRVSPSTTDRELIVMYLSYSEIGVEYKE